jgi:hypothetical protein
VDKHGLVGELAIDNIRRRPWQLCVH